MLLRRRCCSLVDDVDMAPTVSTYITWCPLGSYLLGIGFGVGGKRRV